MPRMLAQANHRLTWHADGSIAAPAAPPAASLTTGAVNLSCLVAKSDFALGPTGDQEISDAPLCAEGDVTAPGATQYEAEMNFYRYTATAEDIPWSTFTTKGLAGFLVRRIGKKHDLPYVATDVVEVYPVVIGTPRPLQVPDGGGYQKFRLRFHVQEGVVLRAVVAA